MGARLSVEQALRLFTLDAARSGHEEGERGSLVAGKIADFVVLSGDPRTADRGSIKDVRPVKVFVRGTEVVGFS